MSSIKALQDVVDFPAGDLKNRCARGFESYCIGMILERFPEIQKLTPTEKLLVVSELWNDLEANPSNIPVSPEILEELNRRWERFEKHPEEVTTWEAAKARITSQRK